MTFSKYIFSTWILLLVLLAAPAFSGTGSAWDLMTWASGPSDTENGTWVADDDTDGDGVSDSLDDFADNVAASVDTDDDGMPDEFHVFCDLACQSASGLTEDDDNDNDGYSDQEEEEAGSNPLDANDTPKEGSNILKILPLLLEG